MLALGDLHINRYIDQDRTRAPACCYIKSLADRSCQILDVLDYDVVFGDGTSYTGGICLLKGVVADKVRANLTCQGDQRYRIHHGSRKAGNEIRSSRPGSGDNYSDLAGRACVSVGHVTSALLVTGNYKLDRCIVKLVKQRQNYAAKIAEHNLNSLLDKRIDNYLAALLGG